MSEAQLIDANTSENTDGSGTGGDSEFDRDTSVRRREPGCYDVELSAGWSFSGTINGGYLMALVGRALGDTLVHPDPFTVTAHYLTASKPGPATVRTRAAQPGRALSHGQATVIQTGKDGREVERVQLMATFGDLDQLSDEVLTSAKPPALPPVEQCIDVNEQAKRGMPVPEMMQRLQFWLDPATAGWALGEPSGRGEMRAWLGLADGRDADPLSLLMAADALPPTAFELGKKGWVPTVELTVHVRCRPAPGLLAIGVTTRNLAGGLLEEDAEIWDSQGRLVAQSRQLARVREERSTA